MERPMHILIILLLGCFLSWSVFSMGEDTRTLSIGVISNHPSKHIIKTKPLMGYLQKEMDVFGYQSYEIIVKTNIEDMIKSINRGEVDIVSETLYGASQIYQQTVMEPILLRWKKNVSRYNSYFITRKDSEINVIEDVIGRKIVFEDPGSTSGYYLPMVALKQHQLPVNHIQDLEEVGEPSMVNYVFSSDFTRRHNEVNISTWVYHRKVDVGVLSSVNWEDNEDVPIRIKEALKLIYKTPSVPRSYMLVRSTLPASHKTAIRDILLQAHESASAHKALKKYQRTSRFSELSETDERLLESTLLF
ncbi:phosphate/phosphite/phosphonate ABC transporter substrate-binding protein [Photobacterium minamisatsumaniensis]|uniref:phosphate/phosphite/phosphonate ABC transporter substrate-binding protein n=1 Tax=Photobacterium minamisatsumaniensis TaxID=2910233 RepID=UPI003D148D84